MSHSTVELYKRGEVGRLKISWAGAHESDQLITHATTALGEIKKLIIIAECLPHLAQTCFRMLVLLTRKLGEQGIKSAVVFSNPELRDAAEVTGFSNHFQVWPSEKTAGKAIGIARLQPLAFIQVVFDQNSSQVA